MVSYYGLWAAGIVLVAAVTFTAYRLFVEMIGFFDWMGWLS